MSTKTPHHFIDYSAAVKPYEGESPRLTREKMGECLTDLERGVPVALMNRKMGTQPMTALVYADETALLWPRSPNYMANAIGRYYRLDMKECRRINAVILGYRRNCPILIGMGIQLIPVGTRLPGGGRGISFLCRHFFIPSSEEKLLVALDGLAVAYVCSMELVLRKFLESMWLCQILFEKELLKNGSGISLANNPLCGCCPFLRPCLDLYDKAFKA